MDCVLLSPFQIIFEKSKGLRMITVTGFEKTSQKIVNRLSAPEQNKISCITIACTKFHALHLLALKF